jgi:hypothetical protein
MVSQNFFLPVIILLFLALFFGFAVVIFLQTNRIKNLLKLQYLDLWENLGLPQVRFFPVSRDLLFNQFIMKKQYQKIEDITLKNLCHQNRQYTLYFIILFSSSLVAIAAILYLSGYR